jgi:hypothetical protein
LVQGLQLLLQTLVQAVLLLHSLLCLVSGSQGIT